MTPRTTFLSVLILTSLVALAQTPIFGGREAVEAIKAPVALSYDVGCQVVDVTVLDGDTIRGTVLLPFGIALVNQTIRANDFDAFESSKHRQSEAAGEITDAEVVKGKRVSKELCDELSEPDTYLCIKPGLKERDTYGRILASWNLVRGNRATPVREIAAQRKWLRGNK